MNQMLTDKDTYKVISKDPSKKLTMIFTSLVDGRKIIISMNSLIKGYASPME